MLLFNNILINIPLFIICLIVGIKFFKKSKNIKQSTVCEECGNIVEEHQKVCNNCGNPLKDADKQKLIYKIIVCVCALGFLYSGFNLLRFVFFLFNFYLH